MYIIEEAAAINVNSKGLTSIEEELMAIKKIVDRSLELCIVELGNLGMIDECQEILDGMNPPDSWT